MIHGYCAVIQVLFGVNQRLRVEDVDSPLVAVRPVKTVLLAVVTGDRGLCGGYNNQVIKKVRKAAASKALQLWCSHASASRTSGLLGAQLNVQMHHQQNVSRLQRMACAAVG